MSFVDLTIEFCSDVYYENYIENLSKILKLLNVLITLNKILMFFSYKLFYYTKF